METGKHAISVGSCSAIVHCFAGSLVAFWWIVANYFQILSNFFISSCCFELVFSRLTLMRNAILPQCLRVKWAKWIWPFSTGYIDICVPNDCVPDKVVRKVHHDKIVSRLCPCPPQFRNLPIECAIQREGADTSTETLSLENVVPLLRRFCR